jgi:PadR family transcriptional regulator AphA
MSLDHAILGFVNERPRSGYDLKKAFDATVAHIWPAKQSQIYLTLARLKKSGFVDLKVVRQDGKPNRKVYHVTGAGLQELRRWLADPISPPDVRDAFLVQMTWSDAISGDEILGLLDAFTDARRRRLDEYHGFQRKLEGHPPRGKWSSVLIPLAVEQLVMVEEASLAWADIARQRVAAMTTAAG